MILFITYFSVSEMCPKSFLLKHASMPLLLLIPAIPPKTGSNAHMGIYPAAISARSHVCLFHPLLFLSPSRAHLIYCRHFHPSIFSLSLTSAPICILDAGRVGTGSSALGMGAAATAGPRQASYSHRCSGGCPIPARAPGCYADHTIGAPGWGQ